MEPLIDTRINHWIEKIDERFAQTGEQSERCTYKTPLAAILA